VRLSLVRICVFLYLARTVNAEYVEDSPKRGHKRNRTDMTDGDGEEESDTKKMKIEDHKSTVAVFEEELKRKEEEAAFLKRRLMELESKDAEFQRKQEDIEKQKKLMFDRIEEVRKERERVESTAKANEEALIAQMKAKEETLKEQAKLLEEKLQNEKRTFDEEIQLMRRKLDEHEKADSSDRTMLKQLQEQLKSARAELEKSSTEYIERSSFEEEFTCSICQELLLDARTLECAHSFCSSCLDDWKKQKSECPICRKKIDKPPVRALNIDSIVSKLVTKLPQDDKQEWERRMAVRSQKQQVEKLKEMIETARQRNLRFLDIKAQWKDVEKATFKDGVSYAQFSTELECHP
jgi:DNA repair exonuclease SbcCD ATPase subunit